MTTYTFGRTAIPTIRFRDKVVVKQYNRILEFVALLLKLRAGHTIGSRSSLGVSDSLVSDYADALSMTALPLSEVEEAKQSLRKRVKELVFEVEKVEVS